MIGPILKKKKYNLKFYNKTRSELEKKIRKNVFTSFDFYIVTQPWYDKTRDIVVRAGKSARKNRPSQDKPSSTNCNERETIWVIIVY